MKRTLLAVGLTAAFLLALVLPGYSQETPDGPVFAHGPDVVGLEAWGAVWFSASYVLNPDGTVSSSLSAAPRRGIEQQKRWFDRRFGSATQRELTEGSIPPRSFCMPVTRVVSPPTWEKVTDVMGTLLLSEVAAKATVTEVEPGFRAGGAPVLRLALSDAVSLHSRSPLPEYVLVPVGRLVVGGRVYCGDDEGLNGRPPSIGDQVVVIGPWGSQATVNVGNIGSSSLALVDGTALEWVFGEAGPETLARLFAIISEAEAEGLFNLTSDLAKRPYGSEEKHLFGRDWNAIRSINCPPSVERLPDGEGRLACRKTRAVEQ